MSANPQPSALPPVLPDSFDPASPVAQLGPCDLLEDLLRMAHSALLALVKADPRAGSLSEPTLGSLGSSQGIGQTGSASGGDDENFSLMELLSPWGQHPNSRLRTLRVSNIGLGQLEVAEKLVLRNRRLARMKADINFRLFQIAAEIRRVDQELDISSMSSMSRDLQQRKKELVHFQQQQQQQLLAIVEERERNLVLIMNAFARVDELAQNVFGGTIYRMIADTRASDQRAKELMLLSPRLEGPLPQVFGYNVFSPMQTSRVPESNQDSSAKATTPGRKGAMKSGQRQGSYFGGHVYDGLALGGSRTPEGLAPNGFMKGRR